MLEPLKNLFAALLCVAGAVATAGSLRKADIEALFPPPQVVGERGAELPVWPIFVRTGGGLELQAHVFETIDLEPVAGYGGKPTNLLVVMARDGSFRDVRLLSHAEPIFKDEKGTATLAAFARQYRGLTVNHDIQVLGPKAQRVQTETSAILHGVLAGTVSAMAIDKSILESAAQVAQARARDATGAKAPVVAFKGPNDRYRKAGFNALAAARLVQPLQLSNREVELAFRGRPGAGRDAEGMIRPGAPAVDAWLALPGLPQAGRNLLDAAAWAQVRSAREQGRTLLLVLDGGRYPVLGDAPPDRPRAAVLQLQQGAHRYRLQAVEAAGGLALSGQRSGVAADAATRLFEIRPEAVAPPFDAWQPFDLKLGLQRGADDPATVGRVEIERRFEIPDAAAYRPQRETPAWMAAWAQRGPDLAVLAGGLAILSLALLSQGWLSARPQRLRVFRTAYLVFTLGFIGWWAQGQLTIVTFTSAIEAARAGTALDFLLADPMAVLLWAFTGLTLFVWGRGTFCGWLCPFGALQELASRIVGAFGLKPRVLRRSIDQRLKWIKYGVLGLTLGAAGVSAAWTEALVEIEPFKTSISMYFLRGWPYVAWALACIAAGVLVYRGYCRYLCPLGAALAILGRLRTWGWIPRRAECGTPCQTCRHRCAYQAITAAGRVQYEECFQCLDCVALHQDDEHCLPLLRQHKGARVIPIAAAA
jgi:transcriptional regulator of nitric oxide reductase